MRDGYTLVAIGWELGLAAPNIGVSAPPVTLPSSSSVDAIAVDVLVDARATESFLVDASGRPPSSTRRRTSRVPLTASLFVIYFGTSP